MGFVEEYSEHWHHHGNYLCVSDHGMMGAVPRQIKACESVCDKYGKDKLNPIFACELYVNKSHFEATPDEASRKAFMERLDPEQLNDFKVRGSHLLAIAVTDEGYKNLVRLCSWGHLNGFYGKPRVNHEILKTHKAGLVFTSCCYASEIGRAFDTKGEEAAEEVLKVYMEMFKGQFYLEIMMLDFVKQKPYDIFIIKMKEKYGLPIILSQDVHYCKKEDSHYQRLMLMVQTKRTLPEIEAAMKENEFQDFFELQDTNLWMKSEEELNSFWQEKYTDVIPLEIFEEAKKTTVDICRSVNVTIDRSIKFPTFPDEKARLLDLIVESCKKRHITLNKEYKRRLYEEYDIITRKGFASYFIVQKMMADEARKICPTLLGWGSGREAIGPARGCLQGDVSIVLKNGMSKPISEIVVGDEVWTQNGTSQKVIETFKYTIENETLVKICNFYGDNRGLTLTKDHKVLVERGARHPDYQKWARSTQLARKSVVEPTGNLEWIKAEEIQIGDWVFVPQIKLENMKPKIFDFGVFANGHNLICEKSFVHQDCIPNGCIKAYRRKTCKRYLDLNNEVIWNIIGLFAGDGWMRSRGDAAVCFAMHSEETDTFDMLVLFCKNMNFDFSFKKHANKKLIQFFILSRYLRMFFESLFCLYKATPDTKHIPDQVFSLPKKYKYAFLKGYFLADGHESANKITFSTKSHMLASQTQTLLRSLGLPASFNYSKRLDKRTGKESYEINVDMPPFSLIGSRPKNQRFTFRRIDGGILQQVRKVELVDGVKEVYDLHVENNHNYLTSSCLVHNSGGGSLILYLLGVTDVDPIKHGLLFSRFLSEARGGKQIKLRW